MVTIRNATREDAGRILEIYRYYVEHTAISFEYETPSLAEFQQRMETTMRRYPYLVLLQDGQIEGYAYGGAFSVRAAYEWSSETTVYLDRNARKQGFGKALYAALEQSLRDMGIRNLYACVACPEHDDEYLTANSAGFHAHLGFVKAGEFHKCGYKFGRWYNMIWMEKFIGEHEANPSPVTRFPERDPRDIE